jgi:hypothetical protein
MYLLKGPVFNVVMLCGCVEWIAFLMLKIGSRKQQHGGHEMCAFRDGNC